MEELAKRIEICNRIKTPVAKLGKEDQL